MQSKTGTVAGREWIAPAPRNVSIGDGESKLLTLEYADVAAQSGTAPVLVPFEIVSTSTTLPYAYVGQIRSNSGAGSGFVVRPRVVATAGHVVFDDQTLAEAPVIVGVNKNLRAEVETHHTVIAGCCHALAGGPSLEVATVLRCRAATPLRNDH